VLKFGKPVQCGSPEAVPLLLYASNAASGTGVDQQDGFFAVRCRFTVETNYNDSGHWSAITGEKERSAGVQD